MRIISQVLFCLKSQNDVYFAQTSCYVHLTFLYKTYKPESSGFSLFDLFQLHKHSLTTAIRFVERLCQSPADSSSMCSQHKSMTIHLYTMFPLHHSHIYIYSLTLVKVWWTETRGSYVEAQHEKLQGHIRRFSHVLVANLKEL